MTSLRILSVAAAAGLLSACAYPVGVVEQGAAASAVYFPNAPAGARALVDGRDAGEAAIFDGSKTILTMTPGRHQIRIEAASGPLFDQPVFVGAGARLAIKVP